MLVTSKPFKGMTLSRLLTASGYLSREGILADVTRTVEAPDDWLLVISLLDRNLYMWVLAC